MPSIYFVNTNTTHTQPCTLQIAPTQRQPIHGLIHQITIHTFPWKHSKHTALSTKTQQIANIVGGINYDASLVAFISTRWPTEWKEWLYSQLQVVFSGRLLRMVAFVLIFLSVNVFFSVYMAAYGLHLCSAWRHLSQPYCVWVTFLLFEIWRCWMLCLDGCVWKVISSIYSDVYGLCLCILLFVWVISGPYIVNNLLTRQHISCIYAYKVVLYGNLWLHGFVY